MASFWFRCFFIAIFGFYRTSGFAEGSQPAVVAYYYPWYHAGDWTRHEYVESPILGEYGTDDPSIAEKHVDWASQYGIDALFVSWWGSDTLTSRHLRSGFLKAKNLSKIRYGLYYETLGILDETDGKKDGIVDFSQPGPMQQMVSDFIDLKANHFGHEQYFSIGGRPVVGFYVSRVLRNFEHHHLDLLEQAIGVELFTIGDEAFFGDQAEPGTAHNGLGVFDAYSAYNMFEPRKVIEGDSALSFQSREAFPIFRDWARETVFFPGVIPRYHDFRGHPRMLGTPDDFLTLLEAAGMIAKSGKQVEGVPSMIFVTSFNEWWEGTSVEPAEEYGEAYLQKIREFKDNCR